MGPNSRAFLTTYWKYSETNCSKFLVFYSFKDVDQIFLFDDETQSTSAAKN